MSTGPGGPAHGVARPRLRATIDALGEGVGAVCVAPIGFLADHVEILYDLDIEARAWATARGLAFARTASPNDADDMVLALAEVVAPLLADTPSIG